MVKKSVAQGRKSSRDSARCGQAQCGTRYNAQHTKRWASRCPVSEPTGPFKTIAARRTKRLLRATDVEKALSREPSAQAKVV